MYKKRIMAIVISAIMVFSVFSATVFAEETSADSWDGTADTSKRLGKHCICRTYGRLLAFLWMMLSFKAALDFYPTRFKRQ